MRISFRRTVFSRGLRFTLQCNSWITRYRWRTCNTKEPETLDWIDQSIKEGDLFFDVGANVGLYSLYAALRHPTTRVIAFEPEYGNLCLLKENIIQNHLQDRVEVYSIALSNQSGVSHLYLQDLTPGAALHTESREPLKMTLTRHPVVWREGICALTLDRFCQETGLSPNAIKIDVDGTEPQILEGAKQTLISPALRSLMIELPDSDLSRQRCQQVLKSAGFSRGWWDPQGRTPNEVWTREDDRLACRLAKSNSRD